MYGVNTGYGDACVVDVPTELVEALPLQLTRYHGCGLGQHLDDAQTLAVIAARLNSLAYGFSGVRTVLLERLADLINHRVLPRIPSEGSVGASGDLTPLSYVAAALVRRARRAASRRACAMRAASGPNSVTRRCTLAPKEGLALMNGTAVMTGLACLAFARADHLTRLAARLTALSTIALDGRAAHFDAMLFEVKPHAGQAEAAAWIRADLAGREDTPGHRLQDRYSIRCAPHVIGVARDALVVGAPRRRERAQQRERQSADRSRQRARAARRQLLRRPYRVRDGRAEDRGRQSRRSDGPAAGAAGRRQVQQRPAAQPVGRRGRAGADQSRVQGRADFVVRVDGRGARSSRCRPACSRVRPNRTIRTR